MSFAASRSSDPESAGNPGISIGIDAAARDVAAPRTASPAGGEPHPHQAVRALVIGDDIGIFLAVARSLGRRGIEVHVAPTERCAPGLASRHVASVHILPPYHVAPAAWVDALQNVIARYDFRLILPCSDSALVMLDHHAASFGRGILALPNRRAFAAFTDKAETRSLARRLRVPVADGEHVVRETAPAGLSRRLGLPLVLKPRSSYTLGSFQTKNPARIVSDLSAVEGALAAAPADGLIAEAFFRGEGVGLSVVARRGRVLLAWQHRRLRALSETGASTVRKAETPDPQLLTHVETLAGATALNGVAMFEFRCDPLTGAHVLLEVNPRFWGSLPLAVAAGADFPGLLWDVLTGGKGEIAPVRPTGTVKRSMTGEFDRLAGEIETAGSLPGKLLALLAVMRFCFTMTLRSRFDSWAADDPEPFRVERRQIARRLLRRCLGLVGLRPPSSPPDRGASARP